MRPHSSICSKSIPVRTIFLIILISLAVVHAFAQTATPAAPPVPLITQAIDENKLIELKGNVYPAARAEKDLGAVEDGLPLQRMILVLKRSDVQERVLKRLLDDQKNSRSSLYHKWLRPEQFGSKFGAANQDLETVAAWLRSHGFSIESIAKGHNLIVFSGTNSQLKSAFHTEMRRFNADNATRYANAGNPQIPVALAPVVAGIASLNNFPISSAHRNFGVVKRKTSGGKWIPATPGVKPQFNTNISGTDFFAVGPSDFATIYNVQSLWDAGIDGSGQTIAIVGRSDINPADVDAFRSYFNLPPKHLNVIYNGPNPGMLFGDEGESDLDIEWSGATAKNATIDFVVSGSTNTTDGVALSAAYIVDNNLAPVMSVSYGECELGLGVTGNQFYSELWRQAAAQGITVMVASGDGSSAACDQGQPWAQFGLSVNGIASTPYNVAVGGTDLYGTFLNPSAYWNPSNDPVTKQSALSYMPELPWNNSCGNPQVVAAYLALGSNDTTSEALCNDSNFFDYVVNTAGGGGGASTCTVSSGGDPTTCSGGYDKPAWQSGVPGVGNDAVRDLPDVSLFAGSGLWGSFYVFCESDATPDGKCNLDSGSDVQFLAAGGTSFASPAFAGIMALVNQQTNSYQGNANYELYKLAAAQYNSGNAASCDSSTVGAGNSCQFYDVSAGSIAVPCITGGIECNPIDPSDYFGVLPGWDAAPGYDLAVGLGTVNAYNLVNSWSTAVSSFGATQTTFTLTSSTVNYGSPVAGTITVASSDGTGGSPTGDTSLTTAPGSSGVGLGPFELRQGSATASGNGIPAGTYSVIAHYAGDATFASSNSSPTTLVINKAITTATLNASRSIVVAGQTVTFDVMVLATSLASNPTGAVTFTDTTTGTVLGSAAVQPSTDGSGNSIGISSLTVSAKLLNQGSNSVVANYGGDGNYTASASPAISVSYTPPFSLSLGQPSITVTSGGSATATLTVTANGALPATVVLACPEPLPAGISCSFDPPSIAAGSSTTTSTLTVNGSFPSAAARVKHAENRFPASMGATGMAVLALFMPAALFLVPTKRRRVGSLCIIGLVALISVGAISCGSGSGTHNLAATSTSLSVNPASAPQGTTITFTASIGGTAGSGSPTGTVTFSDGSSVLGSASLAGSSAQFSSSTLALGSHSVIATYGGDANFLSSSSSPSKADIQYQTTLTLSASDSLGDSTTIQVPVAVQ